MSVRRHIAMIVICATVAMPTAGVAEQSFDSGGVRIAYIDEGRGEPLVLLHGFCLSAAEMWMRPPFSPTPLIPALAKEHRVIALDLRGHGASEKPHDPAQYGREMAEDVVRLLDHLDMPKAHVVGYSMGATVAGRLLASHPHRLLSVTFGGGGPLVRPSRKAREAMNATATALERGEGVEPLVIALTPEGGPQPSRLQTALVSSFFVADEDQRALAAVMRSQGRLEVTEAELAATDVPVSFVYGSREATWKVELIAAARRALPDAKVTIIDGRDHVSTVASPAFRAAVLEFVRAHRQ